MKNTYKFADEIIKIESNFEDFSNLAKDYLSTEKETETISISIDEINEWVANHDDAKKYPLSYIETLVIHSKISDIFAKKNKFIFHGSTIYLDSLDNAYIFTAPSGTGKSTHVRIIKKLYGNRINYINDDKPFIFNQIDKISVYGSPWDGKEHLSNNVKGTLKGIFVLSRGNSNEVKKMSPKEAIDKLVHQLHMPNGIIEKTNATKTLIDLATKVPVYDLKVNMLDEAGTFSYEVMNKTKGN